MARPRRRQSAGRPGWGGARGFTLLEVAMVLAIIGLVVGAMLVPMGTQIDASRYERVRAQVLDAQEALLGWAVQNGRLPCPDIDLDTNGTGTLPDIDGLPDPPAGNATSAVACANADEGFLPHAALGVPRLDPWGNRLRYRAARAFTQAGGIPNPPATVATIPASAIVVQDRAATPAVLTAPVPSSPAFLVFSCGKNGVADGANNGNNTLAASTRCGAPASPLDNIYTQDVFTEQAFDDVLFFVDRYRLVERMARAGVWPP